MRANKIFNSIAQIIINDPAKTILGKTFKNNPGITSLLAIIPLILNNKLKAFPSLPTAPAKIPAPPPIIKNPIIVLIVAEIVSVNFFRCNKQPISANNPIKIAEVPINSLNK